MKPLQHGVRINRASILGRELYRSEDSEGVIVVSERGNRRLLSFGSYFEQSCVALDQPAYLVHEYTQVMLLGVLFSEPRRMLLLGLGGGGLVHCLGRYYPESSIQVVELRQAVIDIAYDWFDLPRQDNLQVINDDAMHYLAGLRQDSCDIIFSDLYEAGGMSACQAQQDFIFSCYRVLSESGCLVLNFHHKPYRGSVLMDSINSLFDKIIVHESGEQNCIMFCCKSAVALHAPELDTRAEALVKRVAMPLLHHYRKLEYNDPGYI